MEPSGALTWVITSSAIDGNDEIRKIVLKSFRDRHDAHEAFYVAYMEEVLSRNLYACLDSLLALECYGPSIVDAITHTPLERIAAEEITADVIESFSFSSPENVRLQQQMLRFYRERAEYLRKGRKQILFTV